MSLPTEAQPLQDVLAPAFTHRTFRRFLTLAGSAILTTGRRTVANLLRTAAPLAGGHATSFQRVLSSASWSALRLACGLCRLVLRLIPPDQAVPLVGDDTVESHPGDKVYGKARHRDPVRSSHGYTAWRYGHKWVVLAVLVRFPWATRPWALPVLADLYRSEEDDRLRRRPHRTPPRIMATLLRVVLRWFPDRRFVFVGDGGYGTHELARSCHRHHDRLTLVSKLHPEANLFEPPGPYPGNGRPAIKGEALPKPSQAAAAAQSRTATVGWYGGGTRDVGLASGSGHWYKSGHGLVPIGSVFVRDQTGTHRDEYFFSTDPAMDPVAMVAAYTGRWNLETTFQEARCHLGLETTWVWSRRTVLRAASCLLGLCTVVALLYQALPDSKRSGEVRWPGKIGVTFSGALTSVRRWLWREWVFPQAGGAVAVEELPRSLQDVLFYALAPAGGVLR